MGKITTLDYAEIANRVYNIDDGDSYLLPGYDCALFEEGMGWGATQTDFKGCVYVSRTVPEVVVAFQGTVCRIKEGKVKGGDLLADAEIGAGKTIVAGLLPQYCSAALRLYERTGEVFPRHVASLVGHSLGGALAQVIGHWSGVPFVTFNAPGMWDDIQKAKVFMCWSPSNTWNSLRGTFKNSLFAKQMATTGRNFRNVLDPVSSIGSHYGPVTRFWGTGGHSMVDLLERVRKSNWANVNPFDPAYKEWGEL
jgi:hypothetical protein